MMSSEEETDCFALYGDKLLKKAKRARQRVDAGEPRNSYSSIPNFTSRPGFMSGGIYGAIFNQGRQHFGLFGPGYAPGKMLNELLGRPPKAEEGGGEDAAAGGELAHHVLRDILHGRKKELLQLERELRAAASPDNNNSLANNNNDEPKDKADTDSGDEASAAAAAMRDCLREAGLAGKRELLEDGALGPDGAGDSRSLPSPPSVEALVTPKVELDADAPPGKDSPRSPTPVKDQVPLEAKRARVENIVSTMRSSPAPPSQPQVNGCKKRKLYHPQQHESAAERYAAGALALGLQGLLVDDDDDDGDRPPIQQKLVEKNALKTQLRSMQEQLAEMQQKYVQLCNRMEQESETHDDATSDDATEREPSETAEKPTPASSPAKEAPPPPAPPVSAPSVLSQVMSKMMSAKVHGHVPHGHALPPVFNGALPLVPHLAVGGHEHHSAHHAAHPHHAAAVYLGVSQKIFMEQEARMAKEAAQAAEHRQHQHAMQQHALQQQQQSQRHSPSRQSPSGPKPAPMSAELADRLNALRASATSVGPVSGADLEGLAEVLKSEITASLTGLVDSIVGRFVHQRRFVGKQSEAAAAAAEQLNKDLMLASQLLERRSPPRVKSAERPPGPHSGSAPHMHQSVPITSASMISNSMNSVNFVNHHGATSGSGVHMNGPRVNGLAYPQMSVAMHASSEATSGLLSQNLHGRPPPAAMFQTPKPPQGLGPATAALYGSMNGMSPFCSAPEREPNPEQNEALSLVVTPKKKRHKVTDTRITPRTVSRILAQDGLGPSPAPDSKPFADSPSPRPYHHAPPSLALPTSVAIPNPSLHESQVFSPYSPFFGAHAHAPARAAHSPLERDSPPLPHAPALLHPALLAAAHHASPDYGLRQHLDQPDPHSDCNSTDIAYDGIQPTISFSIPQVHSSTLTPMHLRKAKLMFFWVRYPSSAVLKMYFPDIKFNKNNTAQLVKWFSNFREFYYIQMEKYARQAISEGMKNADELHVAGDSEIYRVLNLHYNRNNHIEVPSNFRYVVEQTLREFFRAIQGGKDSEQSWKKSIYKIISRLDDPVPEYFKSPNFLEQLE